MVRNAVVALLLTLSTIAPARAEVPKVEAHGLFVGQVVTHAAPDADVMAQAMVRRARALGIVHLWKPGDVLFAQVEFAGRPQLLDARADVAVVDGFRLAVGQQIVPVSRSWNTPLPVVAFGERSTVNNRFTPGRRIGGFAMADPTGGLRVWAGAFDTANPNPAEDEVVQHRPMAIARIQLDSAGAQPYTDIPSMVDDPTAGVSVGAGAVVEGADATVAPNHAGVKTTATVDLGVHAAGFAAMAEGYVQQPVGDELHWGSAVQVGQFVVPERVNLLARVVVDDGAVELEPDHAHVTVEGAAGLHVHGDGNLVQLVGRYDPPGAPVGTVDVVARGQVRF